MWIIPVLIFLTGCCVSLPRDQQTQNILPPPSLETSKEKSLGTPFFAEGDWPNRAWWEMFNSEPLNTLIAQALIQNPTIADLRRRIDYAKQETVIARSRLFPLVFFDADDTWEYLSKQGLYRALNPRIPLSVNLIDLTLSFSYEFDFWGKIRNNLSAAVGRTRAEIAEKAQVELITTTAIAQAYFALKTNLVRQALYVKLYEERKNTYNLTKLLQQKALSSKLPPLRVEENFLEAQKLLSGIKAEIDANRHLINTLVGLGPDAPLAIDEKFPPLPEKISLPSNLTLGLLARRPDLMAQIWRAEALAHDVGAAIADFFPDVNLKSFIGLESTIVSRLFNASSHSIGVEPAISLPIFTAGAIEANVKAQRALFDSAIFEYNQLLLRSAQEVADLLSLTQSIFEQKKEQELIVKSAKTRYDITLLRQQKGLDSFFDKYTFEEEVILKELENVAITYNQYLVTIKLIKALGGGYYWPCVPLQANG